MFLHFLCDAVQEGFFLLIDALLPADWSRAMLPRSDHFPPHARINFEGYYTRIHCDNKDTIILITSSVPTAKKEGLPYFVHCSYAPAVGNSTQRPFRADAFPLSMTTPRESSQSNGVVPFELNFGDTGYYRVEDQYQEYQLCFPVTFKSALILPKDKLCLMTTL